MGGIFLAYTETLGINKKDHLLASDNLIIAAGQLPQFMTTMHLFFAGHF